MARKEINVFSLSFLDLLSGALGAVLILYIIVPKMTVEQVEQLAEMETLIAQVENVRQMLEDLANSIPPEVYEQIEPQFDALREQIQEIQATIEQLESRINQLQSDLQQCQEERQQLQERIAELEQEVEDLRRQLEEQKRLNGELRQQIIDLTPYKKWMDNCGFTPGDACPPKNCSECIDPIDITFIVISINWETQKQDIDLWVIDPNGKKFYYSAKRHSGIRGLLSVDDTDGPGLEVFQVVRAYPGDYKIYYNLYGRSGNSANPEIKGWVYYPKGARRLPAKTLTQEGNGVLATTITVRSDGTYSFQDH